MTPGFLVPGPVLKVEPTGRKGFKYTHTIMIPPAGLLSGGRAVSPIPCPEPGPSGAHSPGPPAAGAWSPESTRALLSQLHNTRFTR